MGHGAVLIIPCSLSSFFDLTFNFNEIILFLLTMSWFYYCQCSLMLCSGVCDPVYFNWKGTCNLRNKEKNFCRYQSENDRRFVFVLIANTADGKSANY